MKKLIAFVMGMLLVPTMAFGMQAMSDKAQSEVTGQAGVTIAVDDFKMYQNIDGLWYTDDDGLDLANQNTALGMEASSTGGAASVGIKRMEVMVEVNAITSGDSTGGFGSVGRSLQGDVTNPSNYDFSNNDADDTYLNKAIQIDVTDALPALSTGVQNNGGTGARVPGVNIRLGTMEIVQSNMSLNVAVNDDSPLSSPNAESVKLDNFNADESYGTINIGKQTQMILDGSIEIAPH